MSTATLNYPKPQKPWRPKQRDLVPTYLGILVTLMGTWALVEFTGLAGKLGAFGAAVLCTTVVSKSWELLVQQFCVQP